MCENCFHNEIKSFPSEESFIKFEKKLDQKLYSKQIEVLVERGLEKIYHKCNNCSDIWVLSTPDTYWRGYFIRESNLEEYLSKLKKSDSRKGKIGCLLLILFILTLIFLIKKF